MLLPAVLLLFATAARAEGPVTPPEGGDPMEEIKKAAAKVSQGMKESEEALTKVARGEQAEPRPVDVALPPPAADPHGGT